MMNLHVTIGHRPAPGFVGSLTSEYRSEKKEDNILFNDEV